MNKVFIFAIIFFTIILFVGFIFAPLSNYARAETVNPTVNLKRCKDNMICLGSATKKLCNSIKIDGKVWENDICQIPKENYSFAKYLGGWIDAYLFNLGLAIGLVLILFAGILYMMSGADPGKANTAKDIIFTALMGLALIFLVKIIFTKWVLG